jgi:hypothetical protein
MKPYLVLDTYHPPKWSARRVGEDLTCLTSSIGLNPHQDPAHGPLEKVPWFSKSLHAEVRRRTFKTTQGEGWHQDGDLTPGSKMDCAIVLWATNNPTQIKYYEGEEIIDMEVWTPRPYEVVIFRNLRCLHRRPTSPPRVRWVFRQRVQVPSHIKLP